VIKLTGDTHSVHEEDTHRRILNAALEEFTHHGFKGTSTRAISERACVNEVTLFRHFGSKVEMLKEAVEDAVLQMRVPTEIEAYITMPFRDGFGLLLKDYLMQLTNRSDILMLGMTESFSHLVVVSALVHFFSKMRTLLIDYFVEMNTQGRMKQADYPVLTQSIISTLHATPVMRKRAPAEVTANLTDERILAMLVDLVASAYSLEE
jgi:AcrR family transcriptional regulator